MTGSECGVEKIGFYQPEITIVHNNDAHYALAIDLAYANAVDKKKCIWHSMSVSSKQFQQ